MATKDAVTTSKDSYEVTIIEDANSEARQKKQHLLEVLAIGAVLRILTVTLYLAYRIRYLFFSGNSFDKTCLAGAWVFFVMECLFAGKLTDSPTYQSCWLIH